MKYSVTIPKPDKKVKTVIKRLEKCIYYNDCKGCWLKDDKLCQAKLVSAGLYYLEQAYRKERE